MGTYYVPQESQIMRVSSQFADKLLDVLGAERALFESLRQEAEVSNENALTTRIPPASLDYVFTDPPYVGKIQYGELNFVWESWLGFDGKWLSDEIVVNSVRGKPLERWDHELRLALSCAFSALKPGRWLSLCYHDTEPETWSRIQNALLDTGFEIHTVTVMDPKQKSSNQLTAEKVVKSDLVLNCRKPRPGEDCESDRDETNLVSSRVREILIEAMATQGGQTRDKLWDIALKRLLARGQMANHRFEDILTEIATKSESGRWFLKEEFASLSESDLRNEEEAGTALEKFTHLRCMGVPVVLAAQLALGSVIINTMDEDKLERHIKREVLKGNDSQEFKLAGRMKGCEFYDCLFFYLTRYLKGRGAGRTPRRNLAEFLEEYLVRYRDGDKWLYRPPSGTEAASLRKSRQSGLGRRIRQFVAYLNGDGDFPKERMPDIKTLVAWLKHCANFGLAEAGVVIYEKGGLMGQLGRLAEDDRYDVEDYYAQCRRNAIRKSDDETEAEDAVDAEDQEGEES